MVDYNFEMYVTLNRSGYNQEDQKMIGSEAIGSRSYPVVSFEDYPSASGQDLVNLHLVLYIAFTTATAVIVHRLASDLYDWSKCVLRKVLHKKQSFVDSRVVFEFENAKFTIYTSDKEALLQTIEKADLIIDHLSKAYLDNDKLHIGNEFYINIKPYSKDL